MRRQAAFRRSVPTALFLCALPVGAIVLSLFFGRYAISPSDVLSALFRPSAVPHAVLVTVRQLRLPRALAAAFVGASLSASGAAFQSVFRNPLVNSGILGVSNGAGFGACLAIVCFGSGFFTYALSFLFGAAAVVLSYFAGRIAKRNTVIMLILGGTIVSAFFAALVSLLKYIADPYSQLPAITFWLMGSFASVGVPHLAAVIPMSLGMGLLFLCRRRIDVLSMGEREAAAL
ncbi:MAG: iron ABC transporter permease, partial [Clostridia bacterium]|nr:iron ABC transporter permease [Clostridia bacterium]